MNAHDRRRARTGAGGEGGWVLPIALAFLTLFAILVPVVLTFVSTSISNTNRLERQRDDLYAVSGAIDAAVNRIRTDPSLGAVGGTDCGMAVEVNSDDVTVTCTVGEGSGGVVKETEAPPAAIITLAPYRTSAPSPSGNNYPGCLSVVDELGPYGGELGLVQTQNQKDLKIVGHVYVNSDVDADTWQNHCPNISAAASIQVEGNVLVRESSWPAGYTDIAVVQPDPPVTPPYTKNGSPITNPTPSQASALADPALAQPASWAYPPQGPPVSALPVCDPDHNVVQFTPDVTYTDAEALTNMMNGSNPDCVGKIFWFPPGTYHFKFTNPGSHEWTIDDVGAKVVGGQPNGVPGGNPIGPNPWRATGGSASGFTNTTSNRTIDGTATTLQLGAIQDMVTTLRAATATSTAFTTPANAQAIDGTPSTATFGGSGSATLNPTGIDGASSGWSNASNALTINGTTASSGSFSTSNGSRWITLEGYAMPPGNQIPAGATVTLQAQVAHVDGGSQSQTASIQVLIRNAADSGTYCTGTATRHTTLLTDSVSLPWPCGSLTTAQLNSGAFRVRYQITHSSCFFFGCSDISTALDGIQLQVGYTLPSSGTLTLSGFAPSLPPGATAVSATVRVAHAETNASPTSLTISGTGGGSWSCPIALSPQGALTTEEKPCPALNSAARASGPITATYTATLNGGQTNGSAQLDGIELDLTYSSGASTSSGSVTLTGITPVDGAPIPPTALVTSARLRVAHAEGANKDSVTPTVTITPSGGPACPAIPIPTRNGLGEDPAPSYDVTDCLAPDGTPDMLNGPGPSLVYTVSLNAGDPPGTITSFDGIELAVTYLEDPRTVWNPNNPNATAVVPGACRHTGDIGHTDGVQWVFGGDSRINLRSGALELCEKKLPDTQQRIVLYGERQTASTVTMTDPTSAVANNWSGVLTPHTLSIDNLSSSSGSFSTSNQVRFVTLNGYAMPAGQQIPVGVTPTVNLRVAHSDTGSSGSVENGNAQILIRNGSDTDTLCTLDVPWQTSYSTHLVSVPSSCGLTAALLNTGAFRVRYQIQHESCSFSCGTIGTSLDGIQISVGYASSCIAQTPYYSPIDHSPGYNGACARVKLTKDPGGQRILVFWGTVYTPTDALDIPVDALIVPVFNRGVVARMLMMGYDIQTDAAVPFTKTPLVNAPRNRDVTFVATIPGASTKVVATVEFCDNGCESPPTPKPVPPAPPGVVITSWEVTR